MTEGDCMTQDQSPFGRDLRERALLLAVGTPGIMPAQVVAQAESYAAFVQGTGSHAEAQPR